MMPPTIITQAMNVRLPSAASIGVAWSVPAGARYLGNLTFSDTTVAGSPVTLGSSIVFVDNR